MMVEPSIQTPDFYGMLHHFQLVKNFQRGAFIGIHNDIADIVVGFQVLTKNVYPEFRQTSVDFGKNTGYVFMNMQKPVRFVHDWQAKGRDAE